jgi:hypothetical protein
MGIIFSWLTGPRPSTGRPDHVKHAAKTGFTHRHLDGCAGIFDRHAADQTIGNVHGDGAHHVVPEMLGNLDHQVVFIVIDGRVGDQERGKDIRQLPLFKLNVHDRPHNLSDFTYILCHLQPPKLCLPLEGLGAADNIHQICRNGCLSALL